MPSPRFYQKLNQISEDVGMNPRDLLLVMYMESGVSSSIINPHGKATGLIQFMPDTLRGLGLGEKDVKNFAQRSAESQLDYVKKYIQAKSGVMQGKPFTSATQYYHANYFPLTLSRWHGTNPAANKNVIVTSKYSKSPQERIAYNANTILDTNNDGYITVGDLTEILGRKASESGFQKMLSQFNSISGEGAVSEQKIFDKNKNFMAKNPSMNKSKNPFDTSENNSSLLSSVEKFLSHILAASFNDKIIIYGNDLPTKIEFANILKLALEEELYIKAEVCSNNDLVELDINKINDIKLSKAVIQLCDVVAETFEYATSTKIFNYNINNIKVNARYIPEKKSNLNVLDVKTADINFRKFRLKFLQGK